MAKATIRDSVANVRTLKVAHTAATAIADILLKNGQVLVALNDADADAINVFAYRGRMEFPKDNTVAVAAGDVLYWDDADSQINKTSTDNTRCGIAIEDAAQTDTTVLLMLENN